MNGKKEIVVWCIASYKIKDERKKENEKQKVECDIGWFHRDLHRYQMFLVVSMFITRNLYFCTRGMC